MLNCIRTYRVARGLTQRQLAEALSVCEWTIIRWEKGYTTLSLTTLERLARALHVAPDALFPELARVPQRIERDPPEIPPWMDTSLTTYP